VVKILILNQSVLLFNGIYIYICKFHKSSIESTTITSRQINSKKNVLRDKEFLEMIKGE